MKSWTILAPAAALSVMAASVSQAADNPTFVAAYVQQLVRQCSVDGKAGPAANLIERVDLNGDKLDDWVVDASRQPCPTRAAVFADAPSQVTIFRGSSDGSATPAFQRSAYGARLEGKPGAAYSLWMTLGANDCGEQNEKARCDRKVVWLATEGRFELAPLSEKAVKTK